MFEVDLGRISLELYENSAAISNAEAGRRRDSGRANDLIVWNAAYTEVTVGISVYYGGLNVSIYEIRVRKINGRWIVVGSRMTIIS